MKLEVRDRTQTTVLAIQKGLSLFCYFWQRIICDPCPELILPIELPLKVSVEFAIVNLLTKSEFHHLAAIFICPE
ncbi:hypothetical protein [Nostoc sp. DedQUE09]|uniref:hypothetical protein n=1 Tax=Nostoc sp. DedQUE09 TaxID=3075394 RepID=UPI002AD4E912|nr:hypothetical protein [Nostoc sp. DedQUE09]MDZ7953732.1 hypothetical protein [Nostoc sp. DedQUE09]